MALVSASFNHRLHVRTPVSPGRAAGGGTRSKWQSLVTRVKEKSCHRRQKKWKGTPSAEKVLLLVRKQVALVLGLSLPIVLDTRSLSPGLNLWALILGQGTHLLWGHKWPSWLIICGWLFYFLQPWESEHCYRIFVSFEVYLCNLLYCIKKIKSYK